MSHVYRATPFCGYYFASRPTNCSDTSGPPRSGGRPNPRARVTKLARGTRDPGARDCGSARGGRRHTTALSGRVGHLTPSRYGPGGASTSAPFSIHPDQALESNRLLLHPSLNFRVFVSDGRSRRTALPVTFHPRS